MAENLNPEVSPADTTDETPVVETPEVNEKIVHEDATAPVVEAEDNQMVPLAEVKKIRSEAASLRQRFKASETSLTSITEQLSTVEAERDELREKLQNHSLERAVLEAASDPKFGARQPVKLLKLVDRTSLLFKDDGTVQGVEDELKRLKKEWPELFVQGGADAGAGTNTDPDIFDMNALLRRGANR